MPVEGLDALTFGGFPELGKLRKGSPKQANGQYGRDLDDYFRITSDDPEVQKQIDEIYGAKPNRIGVLLPYADPEAQFSYWQERWNAGGQLLHRCNGVTTVKVRLPDGTYDYDPHPCPGGCKLVGRLPVILTKLGRFASFMVETHGKHDVRNILSSLRAIRQMAGSTPITQVPLIVYRATKEIDAPRPKGEKGTMRIKKSLVYLEVEPSWAAARMTAVMMQSSGIHAVSSAAALDISDEFGPGDDWDEEDDFGGEWPSDSDALPEPGALAPASLHKVAQSEVNRLATVLYGPQWQAESALLNGTPFAKLDMDGLAELQTQLDAEWEQVGESFEEYTREIDELGSAMYTTWETGHREKQVKRLTKNRTGSLYDLCESELQKLMAALRKVEASQKEPA